MRKLTKFLLLVLAILTFLVGSAWVKAPTSPSKQTVTETETTPTPSPNPMVTPVETPKKELYNVVKVIDGDTINIEINGKTETVRLIGIDAPETVDPRTPVQCYGREASDKAKEILTGKNVALEPDPTQGERDTYGRLLRFVFLENGTNFNKLMISEGYAHEYTYQNNPYKYQEEFKSAERIAREGKRGLWADDACIMPTAGLLRRSVLPAQYLRLQRKRCR